MKKDAFSEQRESMVLYQIERRGIVDPRILEAMRSVPRHLFVPEEYIQDAYNDHPLPIGSGQTISQPYIVAFMTNILDLHGDENVLEIGTGSGYQAAVLAQLVKTVHSVERIPELAQRASRMLSKLGITNVQVHQGDGTLGWPADALYQAILVTAAAPAAPQALLDQLDLNGRMVIPVGTRFYQTLELWKKSKKGCKVQEVLTVVFVPLKGEQGWKENEW